MGRELKRVPLGFAWPLNKTWAGYLNPHGGPCPADGVTCFGGYTAGGKWLESIARLISLVAEQGSVPPEQAAEWQRTGRRIYPHPYLEEFSQAPRTEVPRAVHAEIKGLSGQDDRMRALGAYLREHPSKLLPLTSELHALGEGLAGREIDQLSGSCVSWAIANKLKETAGMPETWGECQVCEGHADDPKLRAEAEAWKETEPPTGDGFQLWETTSEGSPVSPVFASLDELCAWCEENATTFGSFKTSAAEWKAMLDGGLVCHKQGNMVFL